MLQAPPVNPVGTPFVELQSVDSTNNYARQLIQQASLPERQDEAQHGMVLCAHTQTMGKGQRGRVWASEPGKNIALSILLRPSFLRADQQFLLSACIAVSVYEFFESYAADKVSIKWPNDLYWRDRKAGGILIESVFGKKGTNTGDIQAGKKPGAEGVSWQWAIAGIGININQVFFPEHLPNPVSLKQITGSDFGIIPLAKKLCTVAGHHYNLLAGGGAGKIIELYNQYLYKKDQNVKFKKGTRVFEAVVKRVTPSGKLVVQHSIEEEFDFGEVEWLV